MEKKVVNEIDKVLSIFRNSKGKIKPHFILTGSSGSGKTYTIKQLANKNDIKYIEIAGASLTKEGTSGNSISKALTPLRNTGDKLTIVFVDEFDKLFISGNSNSSVAHETTTGIQNEFLKILEGESTSVFGDYGKYIDVSLDKVLFIFAGAFNGEPNITIDKLRSFGVKTEFIGRVGLIYNMPKLTLDEMKDILDTSELLDTYLQLYTKVSKETVINAIWKFIEKSYEENTLGARLINTLINQYFIKGGELGFNDIEEISFQTSMEL